MELPFLLICSLKNFAWNKFNADRNIIIFILIISLYLLLVEVLLISNTFIWSIPFRTGTLLLWIMRILLFMLFKYSTYFFDVIHNWITSLINCSHFLSLAHGWINEFSKSSTWYFKVFAWISIFLWCELL